MILLRRLALYDDGARIGALPAAVRLRRCERGKSLAEPAEIFVRKAAAHGHDDPVGAVFALLEGAERRAGHALERRGAAQHRFSECTGKRLRHKLLDDDILRRVAVHINFFKNDAALVGNVRFREKGIEEHLAEDVRRLVQMAVQHAGIKARGVAGRKGVDLPADGVHPPGKLGGGAVRRTLEEHMLDKMGAALLAAAFVARADADPDTDGGGADAGHFFVRDAHAVGKCDNFVHGDLRMETAGA